MNGIIQQLIANPDKFSLQEIMKGVQDGVIPSYIGTPIIADKTKQQQQMQMAAQGAQPAKPPIAQQIMQQAAAQEQPQGVDALPTGLPTRMAQGGILNFAGGGMYDDDDENAQAEEDYYKQQQEEGGMSREDQHLFDRLMDQGQASDEEDEEEPQPQSQGISALPAIATASYEAAHHAISSKEEGKPRESHAEGVEHITKHKTGSHPYEAMVLEEAKRQGVDPRIAMHVLYKETGGAKDPASALSPAGAGGVMQLMPATAKDLGVTDRFDPAQNIRGGVAYLAQLQRQFGEPKLVAAAYNAGPGNVRKYGGVPPFAETQGYVQGLAQGGSVQHFDSGKLVYADPESTGLASLLDMNAPTLEEQRAQAMKEVNAGTTLAPTGAGAGRGMQGVQPTPLTATAPASTTSSYQNTPQENFRKSEILAENAAGTPDTTSAGETKSASEGYQSPYMQKMLDWIEGNQKDIEKSKSEDKYMALIAAGLGMMGGTSPYASANIGQGAAQGLGYLMNARKMQMAQENGVQSGLLGLSRADLYERMHQAQEATRKEIAQQRAEYNQGRLGNQQQGIDRQLEAINAHTQQLGIQNNLKINAEADKLLANMDPNVDKMFMQQIDPSATKLSDIQKDPVKLGKFNSLRKNWARNQAMAGMTSGEPTAPTYDSLMQQP